MINQKAETAQKEIQEQCDLFRERLSRMKQEEWEELIEKEEKQELKLIIEQITQNKVPPVPDKTTDDTDETTFCFLSTSPEEQEKTIQTINQVYLATALGTTHQQIENKCYENMEELKKSEPNLILPEFLQKSLNQDNILLGILTLRFTPQHFTHFKSNKDVQELIKDQKISFVEKNQEQLIYAKFLFFSQPIPSRTSKNTDEDLLEEKRSRLTSPTSCRLTLFAF